MYVFLCHKETYSDDNHADRRQPCLPSTEVRETVAVKVGQASGNEQRGAEHHATTVGRVKMQERHKDEDHSKRERNPCAPPVVKHEDKEREQHVEQEHDTEKPAYANYVNFRIGRQQAEAQRHVGEHLTQRAEVWFKRKVNKAQQSKERQYAQVTFPVECVWRDCAVLYPRVVATAEREAAHDHEQQGEIRKERYKSFRQVVN